MQYGCEMEPGACWRGLLLRKDDTLVRVVVTWSDDVKGMAPPLWSFTLPISAYHNGKLECSEGSGRIPIT
jgi:hypothetical protein